MKENIKKVIMELLKIAGLYAILFFGTAASITVAETIIDYVDKYYVDYTIVLTGFFVINKYIFKNKLIDFIKVKINK